MLMSPFVRKEEWLRLKFSRKSHQDHVVFSPEFQTKLFHLKICFDLTIGDGQLSDVAELVTILLTK